MFKKVTAVIARNLVSQKRSIFASISNSGIYEPDYLDSLKPKYPQYQCLDFQIKGYDFPVLESYQKFLHSVAEYLDLDVSECYALPPQKTKVNRFKPASAVVDSEYKLSIYERNIQISDLDTPMYPLFLRIAQAALPEGVTLYVGEHLEENEERRYVPDKDLLDLKAQLEVIHSGREQAKKR